MVKICSVEGCNLIHKAKGFCNKHHQNWKRTGNPIPKNKLYNADELEKLKNYSEKSENGCVIWKAYKDKNGYGRLQIKGVWNWAHRLSYEIHKGPIKEGMKILHSCHNPSCINPDHLREGTTQDNSDDMKDAGRSLTGEKHPNSKLTKEDILNIRKEKGTLASIGKKYKISYQQVKNIKTKKQWGHI